MNVELSFVLFADGNYSMHGIHYNFAENALLLGVYVFY